MAETVKATTSLLEGGEGFWIDYHNQKDYHFPHSRNGVLLLSEFLDTYQLSGP
jgi:hypothetical protein